MVEEETYLLELVRYLHLNPLRVGIVDSTEALDRYAWTGHAAPIGTQVYPWQETKEVLRRFAGTRRRGTWGLSETFWRSGRAAGKA